MRDHLPDSIDPRTLASYGMRLQGTMPRANLRRLPSLVRTVETEPRVDLQFGIDGDRQSYINGRVGAVVSVLCQRCLEPCELILETNFRLGIVSTEQEADRLVAHYEPLIAETELLLADLIEDELLLVLPVFPRHPEGTCRAAPIDQPSMVDGTDTRRPFADLGALWQRRSSKPS